MSRWVSVVFLQGDEADQALRILDESGPADAVDYLTQGKYGDETAMASLTYGYVYDEFGEGTNDQAMTCGDDALVVNTGFGYVSLLRRYLELDVEARGSGLVAPLTTRSGVSAPEGAWFQPTRTTEVGPTRGLELCPRIGSNPISPFW